MSNDENYSLVKGSVYRVTSAGSAESAIETEGEFIGYQQFGDESAIAVRISTGKEAGKVRIVPCSAVLYVDVIKQVKEPKQTNPKGEKVEFYG